MDRPPLIMTDNTVCVIANNQSYIIDTSHPNWQLINDSIADEDWNGLVPLLDIPKAVETYTKGNYRVVDHELFYRDEIVAGALQDRVLSMMSKGISFEHLLKFHERLQANPSHRAVTELYDFLEHENIPIGEDGCFYAYKSVRSDWTDHHSGRISNTVGRTLEMPRNKVDDNRSVGCSKGFHAGALSYARSFGGSGSILLIVKIDPADVVSVPAGDGHQKVRVCKYKVESRYTGPLPSDYYNAEDEYGDDYNYCDVESY